MPGLVDKRPVIESNVQFASISIPVVELGYTLHNVRSQIGETLVGSDKLK
jgi:hypothetical protein